jgi:hypothetical protein
MILTNEVEYVLKYNNRNLNRYERQFKYTLARVLGFNIPMCIRMRDWNLSHIALISEKQIIKR